MANLSKSTNIRENRSIRRSLIARNILNIRSKGKSTTITSTQFFRRYAILFSTKEVRTASSSAKVAQMVQSISSSVTIVDSGSCNTRGKEIVMIMTKTSTISGISVQFSNFQQYLFILNRNLHHKLKLYYIAIFFKYIFFSSVDKGKYIQCRILSSERIVNFDFFDFRKI